MAVAVIMYSENVLRFCLMRNVLARYAHRFDLTWISLGNVKVLSGLGKEWEIYFIFIGMVMNAHVGVEPLSYYGDHQVLQLPNGSTKVNVWFCESFYAHSKVETEISISSIETSKLV